MQEDPWEAIKKQTKRLAPTAKITVIKAPRRFSVQDVFIAKDAPNWPTLTVGEFIGIDKKTIRNIKRGKEIIDYRLDLHGYTLQAARRAVFELIGSRNPSKHTLALVVTGKGEFGKETIKNMLPIWLNEEAARAHVLGLCSACQKDGGMGAYYLLIRHR